MRKTVLFTILAAAFLLVTSGTAALAEAEKKPAEPAEAAEKTAPPAEVPAPTLYDQLGGQPAVEAAVKGFYKKVLADDRVNGFFKGVDMERQIKMQTDFLTFAFGGPGNYDGKNLRAAHAHLVKKGLNDTHFDVILEHLGATLKELGVKDELIKQAADVANSVRPDVLGKEKPAADTVKAEPVKADTDE